MEQRGAWKGTGENKGAMNNTEGTRRELGELSIKPSTLATDAKIYSSLDSFC